VEAHNPNRDPVLSYASMKRTNKKEEEEEEKEEEKWIYQH